MLSLNSAAYRSRDVLRYDLCLTPVSLGRLPFDHISATLHLMPLMPHEHTHLLNSITTTLQQRRILHYSIVEFSFLMAHLHSRFRGKMRMLHVGKHTALIPRTAPVPLDFMILHVH